MRHQLSGRQLSRNSAHRSAMFRNMAASLLRHETIRTTMPKAKELRRIVEPLITLGKKNSPANKRRAFAHLRDEDVVTKLFDVLGKRFADRPGGYTRILRMDPRPGDAAPMALMQLLDQPEPGAAAEAPAEDGESNKAEDKKAKKQAAKKKVRTQEEKAARKVAKAEQKASAKAKKAAVKKTVSAKTQRKAAAPKKKAAAKKKSK